MLFIFTNPTIPIINVVMAAIIRKAVTPPWKQIFFLRISMWFHKLLADMLAAEPRNKP